VRNNIDDKKIIKNGTPLIIKCCDELGNIIYVRATVDDITVKDKDGNVSPKVRYDVSGTAIKGIDCCTYKALRDIKKEYMANPYAKEIRNYPIKLIRDILAEYPD
jgi:hypothetical protein